MTIMRQVFEILDEAKTWLSTTQVVSLIGGGTRPSVGRALRRLYYKNKITKALIPGDELGNMQWVSLGNLSKNFADAPPSFRQKRAKKPKLVLISGSPMGGKQFFASQGGHAMQVEQGVEQIITEWVAADKRFSAYDVTQELRTRANAGTAQVDPGSSGTVSVGGKTVPYIDHGLVNLTVRLLMGGGKFPTYTRQHTGVYFEYLPSSQAITTANSAPADPSSDPTGTPPSADGSSYDGTPSL